MGNNNIIYKESNKPSNHYYYLFLFKNKCIFLNSKYCMKPSIKKTPKKICFPPNKKFSLKKFSNLIIENTNQITNLPAFSKTTKSKIPKRNKNIKKIVINSIKSL